MSPARNAHEDDYFSQYRVREATHEDSILNDSMVKKRCCGGDCLKGTAMWWNVLFFILGVSLISVAGVVYNTDIVELAGENFVIGTLVAGVMVVGTAMAGWLGVKNTSFCMLRFYFIMVVLLVLCQIGISAWVLAEEDHAEQLIFSNWETAGNSARVRLQNAFKCCGWNTYNDTLSGDPCPNVLPEVPCRQKLADDLEDNLELVGGFALALALLQIIGFFLALTYYRKSLDVVNYVKSLREEENAVGYSSMNADRRRGMLG